jgi:hypothetical protein
MLCLIGIIPKEFSGTTGFGALDDGNSGRVQ